MAPEPVAPSGRGTRRTGLGLPSRGLARGTAGVTNGRDAPALAAPTRTPMCTTRRRAATPTTPTAIGPSGRDEGGGGGGNGSAALRQQPRVIVTSAAGQPHGGCARTTVPAPGGTVVRVGMTRHPGMAGSVVLATCSGPPCGSTAIPLLSAAESSPVAAQNSSGSDILNDRSFVHL
mmetsp:Transcript_79261/g.256939  ORF Transcript_79261/g.256939 Transcript_79261/m.256939 type:complete len:176 (+) Transcript_79261:1168-1695(+)